MGEDFQSRHLREEYLEYSPSLSLHAGTEAMLTFALDTTGVLRHVDGVPNGKQCGCFCPACKEPMIARHGAVRAHSFAHDSGAECRWAQETVLHHLAKKMIAQRAEFAVPGFEVLVERRGPLLPIRETHYAPGRTVCPDSVRLECMLFELRPDVVLSVGERLLLVEIAVTHKVSQSKLTRLRELGHAAVEIDLSRDRPATIGELSAILFRSDPRKSWLVNSKQESIRARLEERCEAQYQEQVREKAAFDAKLVTLDIRSLQPSPSQASAPLTDGEPRPTSLGVRYSTARGALVLFQGTGEQVRIMTEGDPPEMLCQEIERLSVAPAESGYVMTKSDWARFIGRHGGLFGTITNNYRPLSSS